MVCALALSCGIVCFHIGAKARAWKAICRVLDSFRGAQQGTVVHAFTAIATAQPVGPGNHFTSEQELCYACRYETSNHLWLILEYCVGGDLLSILRQDMRLPEASIHDMARDLVVAMQYLHASSIIYCDLKPSNILLDENGRLKLGGFGLSRRLSEINKTPLNNLPPVRTCYLFCPPMHTL
jgi:serine/threonine protein kinase